MESCQISLHLREESKDSLGEGGPPPKMGEWRKNTEYPKKSEFNDGSAGKN